MQRSLSQKYFHGHYILTWTTLKGKKNAGSFSFLLAITMNMSHWRQRLLKYAQHVFPYLWQTKKINVFQTHAQSNSALERFKAAALCKENYPIPSCPQLRRRCGCRSIINSRLYTSTCRFLFLGIKLPSQSLKETSGCSSRSQDTNNAKQHLLFKCSSSQNTLEKGSPGQIRVSTYHIACTDTGLNIWTLLSVDTLNPLERGKKAQ